MKITGLERLHSDGGLHKPDFPRLNTNEDFVGPSEHNELIGGTGVTFLIGCPNHCLWQ